MAASPRICVVKSGDLAPVSETFIRAHLERLPAQVALVEGIVPRMHGQRILSPSLPSRTARRLYRYGIGADVEWEQTAAYLQAFRRWKPVAVLAQYGYSGVKVLPASRRLGIPLVVHFHGHDASRRTLLDRYQDGYRQMFAGAAGLVAVSQAMQRALIDLGAPAEKIHLNPYGVDCTRFQVGQPEASPSVFLAVGRFVEKKAPHLTVLAFASVLRDHPEARLRMIGDGPLLGVCRDLACALKIEPAVTFLGAQPHEVVAQEMRCSRAFVQHSVEAADGDCEGTPVGILEAGASGLPVVATRHAGIPDVVIDGRTGLLVEERDVEGMAAHMRTLLEQPALAGRLGRAARERVATHFSMERSIGRLWQIIQQCVSIKMSREA